MDGGADRSQKSLAAASMASSERLSAGISWRYLFRYCCCVVSPALNSWDAWVGDIGSTDDIPTVVLEPTELSEETRGSNSPSARRP